MTTTDPYVTIVFFGLVLVVLCAVTSYWDWRQTDRERRRERQLQRRVHRNLMDQVGRRS